MAMDPLSFFKGDIGYVPGRGYMQNGCANCGTGRLGDASDVMMISGLGQEGGTLTPPSSTFSLQTLPWWLLILVGAAAGAALMGLLQERGR